MVRLAVLLLLAACGSHPEAPSPPAVPPSAALPTWLVGAWQSSQGARETWVAVENKPVLWSVGFTADGFEVLRLDVKDGKLRFTAWPGGAQGAEFFGTTEVASFRVENPAHDFPKVVGYRREGDELRAYIEGDGKRMDFAWKPIEAVPAPELVQADVDFAADARARGADGWSAWFAPRGAMWRDGRVEGEAIHAAMEKTFAGGGFRLAWQATASGLSPGGELGFTAGPWTGEARNHAGGFEVVATGTFLTIWERQPDGAWRVAFDVGSED